MDWMTLTIELMGLAILLIWTVIPIQEFRQIFKQLLGKPTLSDPPGGFEVQPHDPSTRAGDDQ
jgi:hypothetical protein